MKQSKGFHVDPKPEQKKTRNRATMGPITDIDNQALTAWNRFRRKPSFSLRTCN